MKRKITRASWIRLGPAPALFITLLLVLYGSLGVTVSAQLPLPHVFFGTVEIAGAQAPVGTQIESREADGDRVRVGLAGNPFTTIEVGKYGAFNSHENKMIVQGAVEDGTLLAFYVNGARAECQDPETGEWVDVYPFEEGTTTELNLRAEPAPPPTAGPAPTSTATATRLSPDTPTPGPSPTPTDTPPPGSTSTPTQTPTPTPSPTPASTPESAASDATPTDTPEPAASDATPTDTPEPAAPGATSTDTPEPTAPGDTPTATPESVASASTPEPTLAATSEPSTPRPTTSPSADGGESGGFSALLYVAGLLALVGIVAVAFGVWGLVKRGRGSE